MSLTQYPIFTFIVSFRYFVVFQLRIMISKTNQQRHFAYILWFCELYCCSLILCPFMVRDRFYFTDWQITFLLAPRSTFNTVLFTYVENDVHISTYCWATKSCSYTYVQCMVGLCKMLRIRLSEYFGVLNMLR